MTTVRTKSVLGFALPVILLGGCASVPPAGRAKACINTREINLMEPLDDRHVFVKLSADRNYLFTMEDRCLGLGVARRLAIWEGEQRVCGGVSLVSFEDPAAGAMRCRIGRIDSVPNRDAAVELGASEVPPQ